MHLIFYLASLPPCHAKNVLTVSYIDKLNLIADDPPMPRDAGSNDVSERTIKRLFQTREGSPFTTVHRPVEDFAGGQEPQFIDTWRADA